MHAAHPPSRRARAARLVHGAVAACGLLFVAASCAHDGAQDAKLSVQALDLLSGIKGRSLRIEGIGHADEPVHVADVFVGANPVTGHGAVVLLAAGDAADAHPAPNAPQGADGLWYLPIVTDGDAAHLLACAGASPPACLAGSLSGAYARTAGID